MTDLEKNRVYDIGEIETLKSTAVDLLTTGIDSCLSWDSSITQLRALQAKTPVKSQWLSGALEGAGPLYQSDYEVEKCWIEGALTNILTNIPQQDVTGAQLLEPLNENLQLIMGMIEDLTGCIEGASTSLTLSEFQEKLEGIKQEWEETSLEENMGEFETSCLGMVENTNYSMEICAGSNAMVAGAIRGLDWIELLANLGFDIEACTGTECYASSEAHKNPLSEEEQQANAEYIYDYLSEQGWTIEAVCGLLGNVQQESQMNPGAWQNKDNEKRGYGIVQWSPVKDSFFMWLEKYKGYDMEDAEDNDKGAEVVNKLAESNPQLLLDLQLEYLTFSCIKGVDSEHIQWLEGKAVENGAPYPMSYEEYISSTLSPGELAVMFEASYERSGDDEAEIQERIEDAEKWYEYFTAKEAGD